MAKYKGDEVNALNSLPICYSLRILAMSRKNHVAIVDGTTGESCTYSELYDRVSRMVLWLGQNGINPGDRVACLSENSKVYFELFYALAWIGAVIVPLNMRLTPSELNFIINNAGAKAMYSSDSFIDNSNEAIKGLSSIKLKFKTGKASADWVSFDEFTDIKSENVRSSDNIIGENLFMLLYTSGTTGKPKGCMIPQRTWNGYAINMASCFGMGQDDVYLAFLPLFHVAGFGTAVSQIQLGGTVVVTSDFDPEKLYELIEKYKVTIMFLVPGISTYFLYHEVRKKTDVSSLKVFIGGAGGEKLEMVNDVEELLGANYFGIYGQTESGGKVTWVNSDMIRKDPSIYGYVMPFFNYMIADDNDNPVSPGEVGELCLRGTPIMQGYWNLPEESEETLRNGWHHTGDLFVMEESGLVRMVDRKKYLIKTGGENVYPQEVEIVLLSHDSVADAAVIGILDEKWGEAVKAFVIKKPDMEVTGKELSDWVKKHIAGYKAPRYVEFVDAIPRNASGKVLKGILREGETTPDQKV